MKDRNPGVDRMALSAGLACGMAGLALFHFLGNANRGYIDTGSLFTWWTYQWSDPGSETEHGWLILAISVGLFWWRLRNGDAANRPVPKAGAEPSGPGFAPIFPGSLAAPVGAMVGGLLLHAVGFGVQQARVSIIALLLFAWGVLALVDRCWGRAAAFPLGFMVFAIPLNVLNSLGFWLRLGVIDATAAMAKAGGIGVIQSGTQLLAPDGRYQYDVAAACSGIRSLMALSALSLLIGVMQFRTWWRRAAVLALCFPLIYVGNVARIGSIILAAHWGGQRWGERMHDIMGYGVFVIVLGGVFASARLIEKYLPEKRLDSAGPAPRVDSANVAPAGRLAVAAAAAIVLLVAAEGMFLRHVKTLPPRDRTGVVLAPDGVNPVRLPAFLGNEWVGRTVDVTSVEREILPPDTGFSRRTYVPIRNPADAVFLSIVLSGRDRTSIHRPELCVVAQGWTIESTKRHTFEHPGGGRFEATVLHVRREQVSPRGRIVVSQIITYWFVAGDEIVATPFERTVADIWQRLRSFRADRWAYVLAQTDARQGEAGALARVQDVLNQTLPQFQPAQGR